MKKFECQIGKVTGHCSCGYKVGDVLQCDGIDTFCVLLCGDVHMTLFPIQVTPHNGATFSLEENPKSKGDLACPDNGYVVFKVILTED